MSVSSRHGPAQSKYSDEVDGKTAVKVGKSCSRQPAENTIAEESPR